MMQGRAGGGDGKKSVSGRRFIWYLGVSLMKTPLGYAVTKRVLSTWAPFGQRVVVVGWGLPGIELVHFLTERSKKVTVVDTREDPLFGEPPMPIVRQLMEWRLGEMGTAIMTAIELERVTDKGQTIINKKVQRQTLGGDTVVFASEYRSNTELL
jgi:pyruvate/2-oxoglutarate dehydrogenase complex dihydrolipoamide dehydrogenase (E3) component